MSSAIRKMKRSIQKAREYELISPDGSAPTLVGKLKPVDGGTIFHQVGVVDSPYRQAFTELMTSSSNRQGGAEVNAVAKMLERDTEESREIGRLNRRLEEAYIVFGFRDVRIKESGDVKGDPVNVVFSDQEDPDEESDAISVSELRELYGDLAINMLDERLYKLSNGGKSRKDHLASVVGGAARERFPAKSEVN